jgi:hypothetical protein
MSLFVPFRRATLLIPTGAAHDPDRKHLFIVLTDPAQVLDFDEKHSLLVGVYSINPDSHHDPACELYAGDHAFIRHKSYVHYARARIESSQSIVNGVRKGLLVPKAMLVEEIFARVCRGLVESRFTPPIIVTFYKAAEAERNADQ